MNVVFDFGGVLFTWSPKAFIGRLLPEHVDDEASAHAMVETFFEGYRGDWGEFDRGLLDVEPLAQRIHARTGLPIADVLRVIHSVPQELQPIEGSVELLFALHEQGVPLYFLSNMPEPYAQHLEREHDFLDLFRAGIFSARARLTKPDPAIFAHAAQTLGIDPARTVFIDDVPENVQAARDAGWQAIVFTGPQSCAAELRALGVLRDPPTAP